MTVQTFIDFSKKIAESLNMKVQQVDDLFNIGEDRNGYFVATLYPKKFLDKEQFKMMCGLVKDLGGEGYLQGAKSWMIPGPMAKKSPTPIPTSGIAPNDVKDDKRKPEVPKVLVGSEQTPKPPMDSAPVDKSPNAIDEEIVESLKGSSTKIGHLYPILVDSFGNTIDGFHRRKANPNWPTFKVEAVTDALQLAKARLIANERRNVPAEEKKALLNQIAKMTGWTPKQIAEDLGWSEQTIYRYLSTEFKNPEKIEAGKAGGQAIAQAYIESQDSALSLRPESQDSLQSVTYGKAKEILDTPAGREVLIDAVKDAVAKGEIPVSLDKEEPLFAEGIATVEDEHEPIEGSEKPGVGSSELVHRHKVEGTQVGEFTCTECNQHFFIDHISADKHRLTKVGSAPE